MTASVPNPDKVVTTPTGAATCREGSQCDLKYSVHLDDWAIALIKLGYSLTRVELPPMK